MKKLFWLVFLLCGPVRMFGLDREAFTFTKYELNVRVEPEQQRLGVRGKVTVRNDSSSPQRNVTLQISSSLHWSSITFEGKPVELMTQPYVSDIDHTGALSEVIVVLPQAVAPKQSIDLEVGYEGVIPLDTTRLTRIGVPQDTAKHTDWDQISPTFIAVRGIGYVAWYPIATQAVSLTEGDALPNAVARWNQREQQAEMNVNFANSNSSGMRTELACNGQLSRADSDLAHCTFERLDSTVPLFAVSAFKVLDRPGIKIFYLPEHNAGANDYAAAIDEVSPFISKWFGDHRKQPDAKVQTIDLPDSSASSYESGGTLLIPMNSNDTKFLLAAARQIAHLFFPSPRAWIRGGLASYVQVRLIEEKEDHGAGIAYLQAHSKGLQELDRQAAVEKNGPDDSLISAPDEFRIQAKAMYVWWMLRDMVSETALDGALQTYKAADDSNPTYMQKLVETQSHRDLQWFFDDWVYHDRGLPDFHVASVYPSALPTGGYMVTVTVENLGGAAAEIPVTVHMQDGEKSERLMVRGKSKASIRIQVPSAPQSVTVNDGGVPESDMSNNQYNIETFNH